MTVLQKYLPLVGRTFLAIIFIRSGIGKILDFGGTQDTIANAGLPLAFLVTVFTILFQIAGGLSLIAGYKARIGAVLLLIFLIPATLVFHNPIADPSQMTQFMKNLAIIGGIAMVLAYGSGPISLDSSSYSTSEANQESMRSETRV